MQKVNISELKNRLSYYLRLVKRGETIEVLERSVPIAQLVSIPTGSKAGDEGLERLIREGVVTRGSRRPSKRLLEPDLIPCKADAVRVLIEERGDR